jgi:hypothetical protein
MEIRWKMKKVMTKKTVQLVMDEVKFRKIFEMIIFLIFSGVELRTNEYASRHEENRITATTKDHNMKRKLEVNIFLILSLGELK